MSDNFYLDEEVEFIKNCAASGMSAKEATIQVNEKFGKDRTKNSLIGISHRKGFHFLSKPMPKGVIRRGRIRASHSKKMPEEKIINVKRRINSFATNKRIGESKTPAPLPEQINLTGAFAPLNFTLEENPEGCCMWPTGENPFTFCGHPVIGKRKPYCVGHSRKSPAADPGTGRRISTRYR